MKAKTAISIDKNLLNKIDKLVQKGIFKNRNEVIQTAVMEKFSKITCSRLAIEKCKT